MKKAGFTCLAVLLCVYGGTVFADEMSSDKSQNCQDVFGGQVCTWGEYQDGNLVAFGATVPLTTIENSPTEGPMAMPPMEDGQVAFPEDVQQKAGIDHLGINWEKHGHEPPTFMTPHYDFHFYTISPEEVSTIDCSNHVKPDSIPEGYVLPDVQDPELGLLVGTCVPAMGMHSLLEKDMNATELFSATMIVGYYNAKTIFIEPMIARETLLKRETFSVGVPKSDGSGGHAPWPTSFTAAYDPDSDAYRFTFSLPTE